MNFKGKYTIVRKDKKGRVLLKKSQYNKITSVGKNVILNLLKNASAANLFNLMIGYKPLDLSTYMLTPLLKVPVLKDTDEEKTLGVSKIVFYQTGSTKSDYLTWFEFFNDKNKFLVKSSFFLNNSFNKDDFKEVKLDPLSPEIDLTSKNPCLIKGKNNSDRNYINYSSYDSHLTNGGNNLTSSVDQILSYKNEVLFTWSGCEYDSDWFLNRNLHNIDFFLVKCKQRIQSRRKGLDIPLWNGMTVEELKYLTKPMVKFKYAQNGVHSKNLIVLHRKKTADDSNAWTQLTSGQFTVNLLNMTINFNDNTFSNNPESGEVDEFLVFYNVYYLDKRLKNGICGMYLNYSIVNDYQTKTMDRLGTTNKASNGRLLFGNGVFSYDGFKTLDSMLAFPWQGKPMKIGTTMYEDSDSMHKYDWFYNNNTHNNTEYHKLFTTSLYNDYVPLRFYSFYPYVTQQPTNFVFLLKLQNNKISMKNFVFLVPLLRTSTPRVFVFGGQEKTESLIILDLIFRLDAILCDVETTKSNNDGDLILLITWKTYIDYLVGNENPISTLGLACGIDKLLETAYGWRYIKPLLKLLCDLLFSKIKLLLPITKTLLLALEVSYELLVQ